MNRQYSKPGLELTEMFEGCKLVAYPDQGGVWTIGYGHTRAVKQGMTCTQAQAEQWLLFDVADAVAAVNRLVTAPTTQHEFDAMVDFCFNVGQGNFGSSTLLRKVNAGDTAGADAEFAHWNLVAGKVNPGVARRRTSEAAEFLQAGA